MGDNNNQNIINEVTSLIRRWEEERTPPTYDPVPTLTKYVLKSLLVIERVWYLFESDLSSTTMSIYLEIMSKLYHLLLLMYLIVDVVLVCDYFCIFMSY